ncbi:MAG: alpha-L-arabinofuranosidase C-terminal domain-containing protein [Anaerohalosphaeraceae bacterium]
MGKRLTVSTLAASLMSLLAATVWAGAPSQNLLRNGGFERLQDNRPRGWTTQTWSGQAEFAVEDGGRTGKAARITSANGADAAWSQTVEVPPFARLRLSGWVKTENFRTTTGRGVQLSIHDMENARTAALKESSSDWTKLECEFQVMGQSSVQVLCLFGGWGQAVGTAWFDDIVLEVLEEIKPASQTVTAQISIDPSVKKEPISELIYGQFIEHMGRCIYGGIWAEMLEDRKFFYPVPAEGPIWRTTGAGARVLAASPWKVIGPKENVQMSTDEPLSGKHAPKITLTGQPGGLYQEELGVLAGKDYVGRIVLRGDRTAGPIQVSLIWGDRPTDRQTVTISRLDRKFKTYPLKFKAGAATDNAKLEIVGTGKGSWTIGAVSLMPADNVNGFRKDTLDLLKQLNSPMYRWPGGNFVSGYDWRDGLGDRDRRPTRTNPAWTGIETNDVGMHEFVELCRLLNAEPLITVNTGFGDAYSAAAQVEYANGSLKTPMGQWRARNGSKDPLNVKYWCVGNEMWGNWQLGYMQLHHYVLKHNWVEEKMRQVDPTIFTIASGDLGGGWSEGLLKNCADHMNSIAEHFYCQSRPDLTAHVRQVPNAIKSKADGHRRLRQTLDSLKGKDIRIAMTEWNYWYGPHVFGELGTRYFMKDALGIAAGLHEYFRNSEMFWGAFYAQTVNVIGCIKTTKTAAAFDATGLPLVLYRREFGTLPLEVSGWNEKLDVSAALTTDKKFLTIGIVNASWDTYQVQFDLKSLTPAGPAKGWLISHENPMAHNDPSETKPTIDIQTLSPTDLTKTVSIKPISITLFKVPIR